MEVWKSIKNYEPYYFASSSGKIKSLYKNGKTKILKPIINHKGYGRVTLCDRNGHKRIFTVHRLICSTFIPNMENKPQINHINGNKLDNRIENLEWCTAKENVQHRDKMYGKI